MADISFKISGSSQPFLAQLWNNDCSLLIQQKPIEYSGTCVVFGGLNGNTTYNLNVIDNISLSVSHTFNTLTQLIPPILPIKFVSLLGTLTCPDSYTRQITSPKYVCVNPPLTNGESVDLKFNIQTVNTSNTINSIDLYCNGNILSPSYINCGSTTKLINMKYGDTICYNISSYCSSSGNICGHSILELTGVTGYGFSACTDSNYCKSTNLSVPTTTTTTTIFSACQNVEVYPPIFSPGTYHIVGYLDCSGDPQTVNVPNGGTMQTICMTGITSDNGNGITLPLFTPCIP